MSETSDIASSSKGKERESDPSDRPFQCSVAGCDKSYAKLGHLHRHLETHATTFKYSCEVCSKSFARSDVLARHVLLHSGSSSKPKKRPRRPACSSCVHYKIRCSGREAGKGCDRCKAKGQTCSNEKLPVILDERESMEVDEESTLGDEDIKGANEFQTSVSVTRRRESLVGQSYSDWQSSDEATIAAHKDTQLLPPPSPIQPIPFYHPATTSQLPGPSNYMDATIRTRSPPLAQMTTLTDSSYDYMASRTHFSNFLDWNLNDSLSLPNSHQPPSASLFNTGGPADFDVFWTLNTGTGARNTPEREGGRDAVDPIPNTFASINVQVPDQPASGQSTSTHDGFGGPSPIVETSPAGYIRDNQPVNTPWPHVYKPNKPDDRVDIPRVQSSDRAPIFEDQFDRVAQTTRDSMIALIKRASFQSPWSEVDIGNFPSEFTLSHCTKLYFRHFHDILPILRKSEFNSSTTEPILLLAIVAIGASYSTQTLSGLAEALNELVRRCLMFMRESDATLLFEKYIIQAWLLQSVFGLFSGSKRLYQAAEVSRGGLVTAARRMHLLRANMFSIAAAISQEVHTPDQLQLAYMEDEDWRRLGWGIYLFDSQLSVLLNIPSVFGIHEVDVPLPTDAESANNPAHTESMSFPLVMGSLLSTGKLPVVVGKLASSIVAHTLYRICSEASSFSGMLSLFISHPPSNDKYTLPFPSTVINNPQKLLDQLGSAFKNSSSTLDVQTLNCCALYHHGHLRFAHPIFLEQVKVAAGKAGSTYSKSSARAWLTLWMTANPMSTRRILANAAHLNALLVRHFFDSPSEVIWTFDVAIVMWAILELAPEICQNPSTLSRVVISWEDSADVERWINFGGPVILHGLGDVSRLTSASVLTKIGDRMESMSWGLASGFHVILNELASE